MPHWKRVLAYGTLFYVVVAAGFGLASGSWQVGLHGAFYVACVFMVWLEARYSLRG